MRRNRKWTAHTVQSACRLAEMHKHDLPVPCMKEQSEQKEKSKQQKQKPKRIPLLSATNAPQVLKALKAKSQVLVENEENSRVAELLESVTDRLIEKLSRMFLHDNEEKAREETKAADAKAKVFSKRQRCIPPAASRTGMEKDMKDMEKEHSVERNQDDVLANAHCEGCDLDCPASSDSNALCHYPSPGGFNESGLGSACAAGQKPAHPTPDRGIGLTHGLQGVPNFLLGTSPCKKKKAVCKTSTFATRENRHGSAGAPALVRPPKRATAKIAGKTKP